jgi:DNA-binding response OmpR family regulator
MATPAPVVLIGDPDQATSALYQRVLSASFEVLVAADEASIQHHLTNQHIAVLVLEWALFGEDNWERIAAMSRVCTERHVHLVICSTYDQRRRGADYGVAAYLVKPTLPATLLETIVSVLRPATALQ